MTALGWMLGQGPDVNAEQNLFVGICKHHYLTSTGLVRHQTKPLEPRDRSGRILLTRMIAYDAGTGVLYGEIRTPDGANDVIGFLARAWSSKPDHPMHGLPARLNVARTLKVRHRQDVERLCRVAGVAVGLLAAGFGSGSGHAAAGLDRQLDAIGYSPEARKTHDPSWVQGCSALMSRDACAASIGVSMDAWVRVPPPPPALFAWVDSTQGTSWREFPWSAVLNGLLSKDAAQP